MTPEGENKQMFIQEMVNTEYAKDRLSLYISLRVENENRLERLERLKSDEQMPAMRESDGSQYTAGRGDRQEKATIRRIEYENRIMPLVEANRKRMSEIESEIDELSDPMEREVLRLRYMDGDYCRLMPWKDVAYNLRGNDEEKDLKAMYRLHGNALISYSKILQEK